MTSSSFLFLFFFCLTTLRCSSSLRTYLISRGNGKVKMFRKGSYDVIRETEEMRN